MTRVAVIGAGHNGLVCACFLANAGLDVTVFEANETPGGCVWTEALPSGHRLERGAIEHGPILGIVDELELTRFGLEYVFRDVTAGAGYGDGARFVFHKDLQATLDGLGSLSSEDISGYEKLARIGADLFGMMDGFAIGPSLADISRLGPIGTFDPLQIILGSSGKIVGAHIADPHLAGALTMYGTHAQLPPWLPGTGLFGLILAGTHGHGPGRPIGGSVRLIEALTTALEAAGGTLRTGEAVTSIDGTSTGATVITAGGDREVFTTVVSSLDIRRTSRLVHHPPRDLATAARLAVSGSLNVAEFKVDLALSTKAEPGDFGYPEAIWMLQPRPGSIDRSFGDIAAGRLPSEPSMMWASPSAVDPSAAPDGGGTAWISAFVPARLRDGEWTDTTVAATTDWLLDGFDAMTGAGIRDDIVDMRVAGPPEWQTRTGATFGNPNHIDMTIDQLFSFRPPTGNGYRTDAPWLYLSGAGTFPGGGLSGLPGRNAAMTVLGDLGGKGTRRGSPSVLSTAWRGWRLYRTLRRR